MTNLAKMKPALHRPDLPKTPHSIFDSVWAWHSLGAWWPVPVMAHPAIAGLDGALREWVHQ